MLRDTIMPLKDKNARKKYHDSYNKSWYEKNKNDRKKQIRNRKRLIRSLIAEYKSQHKCKLCEESHPAALDFHHLGDKKYVVSEMLGNGYGIKTIMEEIKKCIILCSNCHRKEHYRN